MMKILIVSDTHRYDENLKLVIKETAPIDMLIHLGDVEGSEIYIPEWVNPGCEIQMVRGNNDFFSDLPQEEEFEVMGRHIFITHGHYYYVALNEERIKDEARERGADIVMYGHTHKPSLTREEDLITLNPGSVAYPREQGRRPSYMVMELEPEGEVKISQEWV